jgi:hypothetical protein
MPKDRAYRIRPEIIEADRTALTALQELRDYNPMNPAYNTATLTAHGQALEEARQNEIRAQKSLEAARDATMAAGWALHDAMLGAKIQVAAQYGPDSDAIAALGLKKKFKHRRTK